MVCSDDDTFRFYVIAGNNAIVSSEESGCGKIFRKLECVVCQFQTFYPVESIDSDFVV